VENGKSQGIPGQGLVSQDAMQVAGGFGAKRDFPGAVKYPRCAALLGLDGKSIKDKQLMALLLEFLAPPALDMSPLFES
jgi:hypothetical protein